MTAHERKKKHVVNKNLISVYNKTTTLADAEVSRTVRAIGIQLARDFAPEWGRTPAVEFMPAGHVGEGIPCEILDGAQADVPGALGYHDEQNGTPYIKVFVIEGYDWRTTFSHEVLELVGDRPANIWVDGPGGIDYAREMSDAVEGDTYEIALDDGGPAVPVSNFVYQQFFDPGALPGERLDHMGKLTRPFAMTSGGYQITRTEPGRIDQVFARGATHSEYVQDGVRIQFGPEVSEERRAGIIAKYRHTGRRARTVE